MMDKSSTYKLPPVTAPGYRTAVSDSLVFGYACLNNEIRAMARAEQKQRTAQSMMLTMMWPLVNGRQYRCL